MVRLKIFCSLLKTVVINLLCFNPENNITSTGFIGLLLDVSSGIKSQTVTFFLSNRRAIDLRGGHQISENLV